MNFKKILLFLLLPFIGSIFEACYSDCPGRKIYFTNQNITVQNLDNSGNGIQEATGNSVPKAAYGIRFFLDRELVFLDNKPTMLFTNTAYAMKPVCDTNDYYGNDNVVAIQIFTVNDFDASHLANSEVTEFFKYYENGKFNEITATKNKLNVKCEELSDIDVSTDILLMTAPTLNITHSFRLLITLSDGRTLEAITNPIDLI